MKKILLIFLLPFCTTFAQSTEYVAKKDFQSETKKISEGINASKRSLNELRKMVISETTITDSLKSVIQLNQIQMVSMNDSLASTNKKMQELKSQFTSRRQMAETGFILVVILILLMMAVAFWWVYTLAKKTDKISLEFSEAMEKLSQNTEKELNVIRDGVNENKNHILFLSDDLKQQIKKIDLRLESDKERSASIDEKVKSIRYESEAGFKLHQDKIGAIQESINKMNTQVADNMKDLNERLSSEIQKISKFSIIPDKEKEVS